MGEMTELADCPSCGGLLPVGWRCCPHCHCSYPAHKRWRLVAAAALGLGAAACDDRALSIPTDGGHPQVDAARSVVDAGVDQQQPMPGPDYGPAFIDDLSERD